MAGWLAGFVAHFFLDDFPKDPIPDVVGHVDSEVGIDLCGCVWPSSLYIYISTSDSYNADM
jgi:hypothetical protein